MSTTILLFGILSDLVGKNKLEIEIVSGTTLVALKKKLINLYPNLNQYQNYSIAVNEAYQKNDYVIKANDVVAMIPPVSGG